MLASPDRAHGMVDATATQADLSDDEGRAALAEQGVIGQAHISVAHVALRPGPDLAAADADIAHDLNAGRVGGHQEDRGAAIGVFGVRVCDRIEHQNLGIAGIGGEPFLAIDHPLIPVEHRAGGEGERVRPACRL